MLPFANWIDLLGLCLVERGPSYGDAERVSRISG